MVSISIPENVRLEQFFINGFQALLDYLCLTEEV
jgi:hypothetical protein